MYVVIFLLGMAMGFVVASLTHRDKPSGNLIIYETDSDGPFIFMEANESVSEIISKKHVVLKVVNR